MNTKKGSLTHVQAMQRWWVNKTPDQKGHGIFNIDLLLKVLEVKLKLSK